MSAMWLVLAGISLFMFFFTITEMSGASRAFLTAGWFGVIVLALVEIMVDVRARRRKPTRREKTEAYAQNVQRIMIRGRSRRL